MKNKQKFTAKQVDKFLEFIKDGMIEYIWDTHDDCDDILENMAERIKEFGEGRIIHRIIGHHDCITSADECGEIQELFSQTAMFMYNLCKTPQTEILGCLPFAVRDKKLDWDFKNNKERLCNIAGLPDFSNKEDILREISNYID